MKITFLSLIILSQQRYQFFVTYIYATFWCANVNYWSIGKYTDGQLSITHQERGRRPRRVRHAMSEGVPHSWNLKAKREKKMIFWRKCLFKRSTKSVVKPKRICWLIILRRGCCECKRQPLARQYLDYWAPSSPLSASQAGSRIGCPHHTHTDTLGQQAVSHWLTRLASAPSLGHCCCRHRRALLCWSLYRKCSTRGRSLPNLILLLVWN